MYDGIIKYKDGSDVLTFEELERLRTGEEKEYVVSPQKGCQEKFLASNADITIFGGSRGGGKALVFGSKVCTPFGFREIQDIEEGDIITGLDGGMQRVLYNSYQGFKDCVRFTFADGSTVDCCMEHLWNVRRSNYSSKKRDMYGLSLNEEWRVWTSAMIVEHMEKQAGKRQPSNISVPLCKPVRFTKAIHGRKPIIDPYFLGVILGDGCLSNVKGYTLEVTGEDMEVFDEIEKAGYSPARVYKKAGTDAMSYSYKSDSLEDEIRFLGLNGKTAINKRIPEYFKYSSIEDRISILQGLMDTDGTVDTRGHLSFTSISEQLANDVKFIVNSIGGLATITKGKAGYKDREGNYIQCNDAFDVYIRIDDSQRLFRIPRKKKRCTIYNGGVSMLSRRIIKYEILGKKECCCIAVTNTDSIFLTNDFVVTHNSWSLLYECMKDIQNKNFNGVILRNEKPDLENIIKESHYIFDNDGKYNKSLTDMTWNFNSGATLSMSYFEGSMEDFKIRFQGKQYAYIGIDEITHVPYAKFKYLITNNRNAFGIRNRVYGTCNPDPDSWVRKAIDWWIGEDGFPIAERDGIVRYCFMDGEEPESIVWGDTPEEVYEQCREIIDRQWKPAYEMQGFDKKTMFIKSFTFIYGKLEENVKLLSSDPNYVANLMQQSEEQRSRDLDGNWNFKRSGDDRIKMDDMQRFYDNAYCTADKTRYVSADIAFQGGDLCIMWLWEGLHIKDLYVMTEDSASTEKMFMAKLQEWGVREENVVYDFWGVGQALSGHLKRAVKFTGTEKPKEPFDRSYKNVKSQCAEKLAVLLQDGEISIEQRLLERRFTKKGKYKDAPLSSILMQERKCIRHKENSTVGGFEIISKEQMKAVVGYSPDFFEALIYCMYFIINGKAHTKPQMKMRYCNGNGKFSGFNRFKYR